MKHIIAKAPFGSLDGKKVELFALTNARGLLLKVTNYGATVVQLWAPDRAGKLDDIVLGFESLEGYRAGTQFFGATVGRVANRIRHGKFELEGRLFELGINDPPNHLHGGPKGWDKVVWDAEPVDAPEGPAVELRYVSKDGEEGYPGTVTVTTRYTLTDENELIVDMSAMTDQTTLVNMAHHGYWNLGGHRSGSVLDHELLLRANRYTPGDPVVPTGRVEPVAGTAFDFTAQKPIGKDLLAAGGTPVGYDHNFAVDGDPHAMREVARAVHRPSGRTLTLEADQPGVQFYAGLFLDGARGKEGAIYRQYGGFCLETQKFPNAINVPAWRDQVILSKGERYIHRMVHRFSVTQ